MADISQVTIKNIPHYIRTAQYGTAKTLFQGVSNGASGDTEGVQNDWEAIAVAAAHNSRYRGKNITANVTSGQFTSAIANGTFEDIYPGDYFTVPALTRLSSLTETSTVTTSTTTFRVLHLMYFPYAVPHVIIMPTITLTTTYLAWYDSTAQYIGYGRSNVPAAMTVLATAWQTTFNTYVGSGKITLYGGTISVPYSLTDTGCVSSCSTITASAVLPTTNQLFGNDGSLRYARPGNVTTQFAACLFNRAITTPYTSWTALASPPGWGNTTAVGSSNYAIVAYMMNSGNIGSSYTGNTYHFQPYFVVR